MSLLDRGMSRWDRRVSRLERGVSRWDRRVSRWDRRVSWFRPADGLRFILEFLKLMVFRDPGGPRDTKRPRASCWKGLETPGV